MKSRWLHLDFFMEYFSLNEHHFNSHDLFEICKIIKNDGVIIFPTDTIYALGCSLYSKKGIDKICLMANKKREAANLSIICSDFKQVTEFSRPVTNQVFKLMKRNLPGPFTFILEADQKVKKLFGSKKKSIGIRIPNNVILLKLVEELGHPLVSTSLHSEDEIQKFLTEPEEIIKNFNEQVDVFIDDGAGANVGSTVVDCTEDDIVVVRNGLGEL